MATAFVGPCSHGLAFRCHSTAAMSSSRGLPLPPDRGRDASCRQRIDAPCDFGVQSGRISAPLPT
jgi:hypothetical protein